MNSQNKRSRSPVTVLGLTLLVISIVAAYLWQQLREQGAQNQRLSARLTALETPVPVAGSRVQTSQATPAMSASSEAPSPPASAAAVSEPTSLPMQRSGDAGSMAALARQMMETPGGKQLQLVMERQGLARRYPDVQAALNLSPQQVEKLFDVLARRETEDSEDRRQPRGPIDRAAGEEMLRKMAERDRAYRADLASVLGDSYPKWDEYQIAASQRQREGWARQAADQLRATISPGNNTLSDAQFQAFNAAVTAEQKRIDQSIRSPQQQLQNLPEANRRLVEVAVAHLNPEQLAAYRRHLEQQTEMMRMALSTLAEDE